MESISRPISRFAGSHLLFTPARLYFTAEFESGRLKSFLAFSFRLRAHLMPLTAKGFISLLSRGTLTTNTRVYFGRHFTQDLMQSFRARVLEFRRWIE